MYWTDGFVCVFEMSSVPTILSILVFWSSHLIADFLKKAKNKKEAHWGRSQLAYATCLTHLQSMSQH
jgi:hypothetical protein